MIPAINLMLVGATALASAIIGLFFLRFWRTSGDRFFLYFAVSFLLEAVNRVLLGTVTDMAENSAGYYLVRFVAYCLIIVAIIDKNLIRRANE